MTNHTEAKVDLLLTVDTNYAGYHGYVWHIMHIVLSSPESSLMFFIDRLVLWGHSILCIAKCVTIQANEDVLFCSVNKLDTG